MTALKMRRLIYTCVFDGFDRIFPPVVISPGVDYIVITDDRSLEVRGWQTHLVDISSFASPRCANRYYKMLGHTYIGDYDTSIYVDGNIRVLRRTNDYFASFEATNAAIGVYRHPARVSVAEEVNQCILRGQVLNPKAALDELEFYRSTGFPDSGGLIEAGVLLKNHRHRLLAPSMELWWEMFSAFQMRDQFSLPFVVWKIELPCHLIETSYRESNPFFGQYPHLKSSGVRKSYVYFRARSYDSWSCALISSLWHATWSLRRTVRKFFVNRGLATSPRKESP